MSLWTYYDVACPYCGAGLDQGCRVKATGRELPLAHLARKLAYRIAKAAEPVRPAP